MFPTVALAALAYVVVPMFQLTPGYPARPSWWFPGILLGLMVGWALGVVLDAAAAIRLVRALSAVAGIGFALLTLRLQARRRRARSDVTYRYWQLGLASAIFALAMVLTATAWPPLAELTGWSIFAGILLLVGGFMSFIIGMLYKIVPFLAWMHLRNRGSARSPVPNMNRLLPEADAQRQMQAHAVALALLLAAVIAPEWLTRAAGAALAVASGWLLVNLLGAVRRYRQHLDKLDRESVAA